MPDGSSLEYVVRPYQSRDPHGTILIPSAPSSSREPATLRWGTQCTIPEVSGMNFNVVCCKDTLNEQERTHYEPKRIYQNNDPTSDNWVDYVPTKTMDLTKKEHNSCGDNLDDIDTVTQQINATLADFAGFFNTMTGNADKNCASQWNFKAPS